MLTPLPPGPGPLRPVLVQGGGPEDQSRLNLRCTIYDRLPVVNAPHEPTTNRVRTRVHLKTEGRLQPKRRESVHHWRHHVRIGTIIPALKCEKHMQSSLEEEIGRCSSTTDNQFQARYWPFS